MRHKMIMILVGSNLSFNYVSPALLFIVTVITITLLTICRIFIIYSFREVKYSFPQQSSELHFIQRRTLSSQESQNKLRLLVIGLGPFLLRNPHATNFSNHFPGADYAIAFFEGHKDAQSLRQGSSFKYIWTLPYSNDDFSSYIDHIYRTCELQVHWNNWKLLCKLSYRMGLNLNGWGCSSHSIDRNSTRRLIPYSDVNAGELLVLRHFVMQQIKSLNLSTNYDAVILTLSDSFRKCHQFDIDKATLFQSNTIFVTEGIGMDAISLRYEIATPSVMLAALSITEKMICQPALWSQALSIRAHFGTLTIASLMYQAYALVHLYVESYQTKAYSTKLEVDKSLLFSIGNSTETLVSHFPCKLSSTLPDGKHRSKAKLRLLVICLGLPRGGNDTWISMKRNLLDQYDTDLALAFTSRPSDRNDSLLHNFAKYIWTIPESNNFSPYFDEIAASCGSNQDWRPFLCSLTGPIFKAAGGFQGLNMLNLGCKYPSGDKETNRGAPYSHGGCFLLRYFVRHKIETLNLMDEYDAFMLTRSDYFYLCPHYNLNNLKFRPDTIYVSRGEEYLGITDRHLIASPSDFMKALSITEELVCRPNAWRPVLSPRFGYLNIESSLYRVYAAMGLKIKKIPLSMFTVRSKGDSSSWSPGLEVDALADRDLLVKYPKELYLSLEYCKVRNLTLHLKQMNFEL